MGFKFKDALNGIKNKIPKRNLTEDAADVSDSPETEETQKNGFFGRVGDYFNPEPQKERVLRHEDFNRAGDTYYASISAFYKIIERLLWLVLAAFMTFSVITNYKEITFNNFFYLLKDFSSASDSDVPNYQVLSYDSDSRQTFELYRGGLVSASPSAVSIFTAGGRRTLKSNTEYYSPNIVSCDKYVLVYDSAGSAFSVYNSFSKVYNERLQSPITDACFASDGSFAVATKDDDGKSVIYLYGKNIKKRGDISDSKYIFDMAIENGGDRFCTVSYQAGSGKGLSTVSVYDVGSSASAKKLATVEVDGEFPIGCSFLENGKIALLTNLSVRIYNKSYEETEKYTFYGSSIKAFNVDADGVSAVIGSQTQKRVIAFDAKGKLVYDNPVAENISAVELYGDHLFMRNSKGVTRVNVNDQSSEFLASDSGKMLIYSEDTAMVCGDARAEYLVFGKKQ